MSSLAANDTQVLPAILDAAVRNNLRNHITGMMLYAEGSVLQVLEGTKDAVHETFRAIAQDNRHSGIIVLTEAAIEERQFANWSMGFKQLAKADLEKFPAVADVFKGRMNEITLRGRSGDALSVLKTFAEGLMSLG